MVVGVETGKVYKDTDSYRGGFVYANTDSAEDIAKEKQRLNSLYGMQMTQYNTLKSRFDAVLSKAYNKTFEGYLARMLKEADELETRVYKLQNLLDNNPAIENIDVKEQDLMRRQLNTMYAYWEVLTARLELHFNE